MPVMSVLILVLFCLGWFTVFQQAASVPLAYYSYFPIGFLTLVYFMDLKQFVCSIFVLLLFLGGFFLRVSGSSPVWWSFLFLLASVFSFALLWYFRQIWAGSVKQKEFLWEKERKELEDLKHKRNVRFESLRHLEKQVSSLINLFEIAREFNECLDFKETSQVLYKKVLPEVPFTQAKLVLLSREADKAVPVIHKIYLVSQAGAEEKGAAPEDSDEAVWLQKVISERKVISEGDFSLFPLVYEGQLMALFAVQGYDQADLAKFEVLAAQLALQVRKISLYEMVRELSIIDGLTGFFVRRHFLERFEEELRRAMGHGFPLAVLMLDIDHFKRYNDDYGHLIGDVTLKEVAEVIRASVRNVDIVARYGGEEFAVVVPETRQPGALEVAERIRSAVARHAFRAYNEETKATVSIGVSVFPNDVEEVGQGGYHPDLLFELLQRADRALYCAKEEGRNRVVLYSSLKKI